MALTNEIVCLPPRPLTCARSTAKADRCQHGGRCQTKAPCSYAAANFALWQRCRRRVAAGSDPAVMPQGTSKGSWPVLSEQDVRHILQEMCAPSTSFNQAAVQASSLPDVFSKAVAEVQSLPSETRTPGTLDPSTLPRCSHHQSNPLRVLSRLLKLDQLEAFAMQLRGTPARSACRLLR